METTMPNERLFPWDDPKILDEPKRFAWVSELPNWTEDAKTRGFHWEGHVYYTDPATADRITAYSQRTDISVNDVTRAVRAEIATGVAVQGPPNTGRQITIQDGNSEYRMYQSTLDEIRRRVPMTHDLAMPGSHRPPNGNGYDYIRHSPTDRTSDAAVVDYALKHGWVHDIRYKFQHDLFLNKTGWETPPATSLSQSKAVTQNIGMSI
jgi:hypothetical protein